MTNAYIFQSKPNGKDLLKDPDVDDRIILERILK
jgi:hypothetical protein